MPPKPVIGALIAATVVGFAVWPSGFEASGGFPLPRHVPKWSVDPARAQDLRDRALRAADVWRPRDPSGVDLAANPPDPSGQLTQPVVRCKFLPEPVSGTTTKFDCVLGDGEVIKVKYGRTGEIHAEVAASRLLTALGFGADEMHIVPKLRCYGCPRLPFYVMWMVDTLRIRGLMTGVLPETTYTDFNWVSVERRFPGREIQVGETAGWAWYELEGRHENAEGGEAGATRAEIDALRLAAVLLAHWDNKASNQRLVCLDADPAPDGSCRQPFAFIQDLGATFGPNKVDYATWRKTSLWRDRDRCRVSMEGMPYTGGTFRDVEISEQGRQLLSGQLAKVTEPQVTSLFAAARFREFNRSGEAADPGAWARVMMAKIGEIRSGPACPP